MCEPVTLGALAAGTAIQAYGQYRQGQFDAAVAENNAELALRQAGDARTRGAYEARKVENQGRRVSAQARTATAASGRGHGSGGAGTAVRRSGSESP